MGKEIEEELPKRDTWNRKIDFLLACIGFSVGLGNVWRFPYLCYKNGGGAFLLPYFICVIIGGIPLFFLEVSVGQFMALGGVKAWSFCPLLQGIGWTTTVIVFFLNCYYNVILAWAFYYLFASFTDKLPWESCDNYWNTDCCSKFKSRNDDDSAEMNVSWIGSTASWVNEYTSAASWVNETAAATSGSNDSAGCDGLRIDSTTEFWENKVLNISSGIDDLGKIKWDLALCLFFAWCVVFFCIWNGIKTSGKVMYVTATSPYIFMLVLCIRMAFLPGAKDGLLFYLVPDFEKVKDMQVWVDAGTQIFFSYSIGIGALTALGSYNERSHNSYRDCIIFASVNSGTSIFAGFIIFQVLGFMAHEQGVSVDEVAESGPGLAFIAYPKAVSQMPASPLWSICFFIMIILLGLDSQFVGVEGLTTAMCDSFPYLQKGRYRKRIFIGFLCILMFAVGLIMVTEGGMYVFQLFDYYSGSRIILLVGFFMCVAVAWIYGADRYYDNLEMMLGFRISPYMKVAWVFMSPAFCMAVFIMSAINYSELTYERPSGEYVYPDWAVAAGWALASCSAICIPIYAVYITCKFTVVQKKKLTSVLKPYGLKDHQLRPGDITEYNINPDTHIDFYTPTKTNLSLGSNSIRPDSTIETQDGSKTSPHSINDIMTSSNVAATGNSFENAAFSDPHV